jgi:hypothetical protein
MPIDPSGITNTRRAGGDMSSSSLYYFNNTDGDGASRSGFAPAPSVHVIAPASSNRSAMISMYATGIVSWYLSGAPFAIAKRPSAPQKRVIASGKEYRRRYHQATRRARRVETGPPAAPSTRTRRRVRHPSCVLRSVA